VSWDRLKEILRNSPRWVLSQLVQVEFSLAFLLWFQRFNIQGAKMFWDNNPSNTTFQYLYSFLLTLRSRGKVGLSKTILYSGTRCEIGACLVLICGNLNSQTTIIDEL
jgi:hypothetical protein